MKRTINLIGTLAFAALLGASAHAACGGGGYTRSAPAPAQRTEVPARYETRQSTGPAMITRMDTARFDQQIRPRLSISEQQSREVDKLEAEVKQKTEDSIAQAQSFDGRQEFDRRLSEILTPDQFRVYRSMR